MSKPATGRSRGDREHDVPRQKTADVALRRKKTRMWWEGLVRYEKLAASWLSPSRDRSE